jgi:hypothetical protein
MEDVMKAIAASILALLVVLVPTAHAAGHCTAAMVKGHYGFSFSGFTQDANGNNFPVAGTGTATNDGQGNISGTVNASFNGTFETFPYTGTYVVNPDCSGSVTSTNGNANFSTVAVRGGEEILGVATNPGETWTIDLKRID